MPVPFTCGNIVSLERLTLLKSKPSEDTGIESEWEVYVVGMTRYHIIDISFTVCLDIFNPKWLEATEGE